MLLYIQKRHRFEGGSLLEVKQDNRIVVWVSQKIYDEIQNYAAKMTKKRAAEDAEKKIPPSRRRRAVSISTAAKDLIQRGIDAKNE